MNHRLTIYSLFKQTEEGDCPFNNDAPVSDPIKQKVWAQQRGKSKVQAKKEYVVLISKYCNRVKKTLDGVLKGDIKELDYKSKSPNVATSTGGALAKSVPKPKNMHEKEDQLFN